MHPDETNGTFQIIMFALRRSLKGGSFGDNGNGARKICRGRLCLWIQRLYMKSENETALSLSTHLSKMCRRRIRGHNM